MNTYLIRNIRYELVILNPKNLLWSLFNIIMSSFGMKYFFKTPNKICYFYEFFLEIFNLFLLI